MDTLAGAATLPDPTGRSFALLDWAARDRLGILFRSMPWIDGVIAASVLGPASPSHADEGLGWLHYVWSRAHEDEIGKLTALQAVEVSSQLMDNYCYVGDTLFNEPQAYQPYLGGCSDPVEAAGSWAHGFLYGTLLCRSAWAPLFADKDVLTLLSAVFGLIRDEDLPEVMSADSPFRHIAPDRRKHMRNAVIGMLPDIVRSLHDHALGLEADEEPRIRAASKIGPVDACPCGSGKKYKNCCAE